MGCAGGGEGARHSHSFFTLTPGPPNPTEEVQCTYRAPQGQAQSKQIAFLPPGSTALGAGWDWLAEADTDRLGTNYREGCKGAG